MLDVLKEPYFNEYYTKGFVETGLSLPEDMIDAISGYYRGIAKGRNDFPKFFVRNEHQAYLNGKLLGLLFGLFPGIAAKTVKRLYDRTYEKAVYADQAVIDRVCEYLLSQGLSRFFKTRYLLVGYDIFLGNDYGRSAAGIHTDLPNFHHFYETENDLTLYIPLVDFDDRNGGRITVLPECKLKIARNVLLKQLQQHFGGDGRFLDGNGYIDPEKISVADLQGFIKSKPYQLLMSHYRNAMGLAMRRYAGEFEKCPQSRGKVLLWSNKNFHAAEPWKNQHVDRGAYIVRLFPIYDVKVKLRSRLHGKPFNSRLIDTETCSLHRHDGAVDLSAIPDKYKLSL